MDWGCSLTTALKQNNLRTKAYPFDWILYSIKFIIKTFEKDYFEFIDISKLNKFHSNNNYILNDNCTGGGSKNLHRTKCS